MTTAQRERLQEMLDDLRHLIGDIEEDARDRGRMEGFDEARFEFEPKPFVDKSAKFDEYPI